MVGMKKMAVKNGTLSIALQAGLIVSIFLAIIGVYIFSTNQTIATRNLFLERQDILIAKYDTLTAHMNSLEVTVSNHCSATVVRLDDIENELADIKSDIRDLKQEIKAMNY
jgi:hypothetical protein